MATSNYTTLIAAKASSGSLKEFVNDDSIPVTTIISDAEQFIYQRLRVRQMLSTATGALGTGADTIGLPARFRAPLHFEFKADGTSAKTMPTLTELKSVLEEITYDGAGGTSSGLPGFFAIDAANIQFDKKADRNRPYKFVHYAGLIPLTTETGTAANPLGGTNTNFLTSDYPHLLRSTAVAFAYEFKKNEREKIYWLKVAESEIAQVNVEGDQQTLMGAEIDVGFVYNR